VAQEVGYRGYSAVATTTMRVVLTESKYLIRNCKHAEPWVSGTVSRFY
jgi:hypothetical protein